MAVAKEKRSQKEKEGVKTQTNGIGTKNEKSLHAALKKWYARSGDDLEVMVEGYIIDLVRGRELVEVQTRNFSAIAQKLRKLLKDHCVRVVYPVPTEKWITRITDDGELIRRRKSPKKGKPLHLFAELIRIPDLLKEKNLIIEVLLTKEEEIWCEDGKGSWRRKGASRWDRRLLEVVESIELKTREDLLSFLPKGLKIPFSNKELALKMGEPVRMVRKFTYCLRKCGLLREVGKNGNELLFSLAEAGHDQDNG